MSTHFATSQRKDMRPLAFKGVLVSDCHAQLQNFLASNSRFLEQHGMPKAASFLAEPVHDGNFGLTDWYTNDNAVPVPLSSLPEAEQRAARAKLADYAAALKSLMQSEAGQHSPQIVEILRRALQHPSAQDVYTADGRPVLINWGYAPSSPNTVPEDIMAPGAGNTAAYAVPVSAAQAAAQQAPFVQQPVLVIVKYRYGFLAWLLPILLLLAFLWLLLTWSGLLPAFLPQDLFRQTVSMNDEENKAQQLHAQADAVHDKLRAKNALCVPPKKEEPAAPKKKSTPPAAENKPSSAPSALPPAEAEEPSPSIPKNTQFEMIIGKAPIQKGERAPHRNTSSAGRQKIHPEMLGCWKSEADLMRYRDHTPLTLEFCLKGTESVGHEVNLYEHDGKKNINTPSIVAYTFEQNLYLLLSVVMPGGKFYESQYIMCTAKGNSMQCIGENIGYNIRWKTKFNRK